ncbi:Endonuclease/exonuclease/phosphatase, partial [Schizophyllum commune]
AKTIATLNINGFGTLTRDHPRNKWGSLNRMMNTQKIAVLMLQETHLTEERKARIESMFSGKLKIYHSPHPTHPKSRAGVAIVVNRRLIDTEGAKVTVVVPGRAIQLTVKWAPNEERTFLCVYAPASGPAERTAFFEQVNEYFRSHTNLAKPHAMAGDFNVLEDSIDRLPMADTHDNSIQALDALKLSLGLNMADGWRATNPDTREFTFCRNQENGPYLARLDRIYCTADSFATARQWKISEPGIRTDHSIASVQLTCESSPEMGKGRPRLSEWVIKDKAFAKYTKERGIFAMNELAFIQEAEIRTDTRNALQVLEDFTRDCFMMGRERERVLVPESQKRIMALQEEMKRVRKDKRVSENVRTQELAALTQQLRKAEVQRLDKQKAMARARHRLEGEIPTAYWSKIHKETKPRDMIHALEVEGRNNGAGDPVYTRESKQMAEMARQYHWHLQEDDESDPNWKPAHERETVIQEVLDNIECQITDEQAEEMAADFEYEEVLTALKFSKNGSSPGIDGIPYEFWKVLNERAIQDSRQEDKPVFDVAMLLLEAFADVKSHGISEKSAFTEGWMCPLYKKGERTKIANYRPITLLNTSYKLLTKMLALRL